jgi:Glycosyl transferase family 2
VIAQLLPLISRTPTRTPVAGAREPIVPSVRLPRVSVAIASYNYGRFLGECLESVVSQQGVELEVIVVDDASSDDTPNVAAAFAAADPRVRVIRHAVNRGHIATFNEGLREARGEYVLKLDADDLLAPGALARAAKVMDRHPGVGLVYGRPLHFEGAPPAAPTTADGEAECIVFAGRDWLAERCRTGYNCISNPEALVRRSLLDDVGFYDARLDHTFDFEMWMRLAAVSDVARVEGAVQGLYRVHPDSFQRTIHAGVLIDLNGRRGAFDTVFEGVGGLLPGSEQLYGQARQRIARQALDQACRAYDRGRVETEPVEEMVAIALDTWPQARSLPEWRALERRRRVGAARSPWTPPFVAHAFMRRVREERIKARWHRHGL